MTHPAYRHPWPTVRLAILDRDGWRCQIAGPTCTGAATSVDHIVPVLDGGAWYDPDNLRAACWPCQNARRRKTKPNAARPSRTW